MDWIKQWIKEVLADIPDSRYRKRLEGELLDHLETEYQIRLDTGRTPQQARQETLDVMGELEHLQMEYQTAWQRCWPEQIVYRLKMWGWGCVVMFVTHSLILSVIGLVDNSMFCVYFLPLVCALMVGGYYLSYKFQALYSPVWPVSVGLFFHWASMFAVYACLGASDGPAFWEQMKAYLSHTAAYYFGTFALCILMGAVFGHLTIDKWEKKAA